MAFRLRNRLLNDAIRFGIVFLIGVLVGTLYPHVNEPVPTTTVSAEYNRATRNVVKANFLTVLIVSAPYNDKERQGMYLIPIRS